LTGGFFVNLTVIWTEKTAVKGQKEQ